MGINYGYQNEYVFISLFNNKFLFELDDNSKIFLLELFDDNIDNEEKIISWKNKAFEKTDIYIKYKNYVKRISLKCGNSNSIHSEPIQEFKKYLEKLKIPYKIIEKYVSYHYGYMKDKDGNTDYSRRLSSKEYLDIYQNEINIFNENINKTRIMVDMIDRFLIKGRNSDYEIDALISGTIEDYVWIMKYDLYDLILSKKALDYTSPHICCLTIGPKRRFLDDNNCANMRNRYVVVVRWNFIKESIIDYRKGIAKKWCWVLS